MYFSATNNNFVSNTYFQRTNPEYGSASLPENLGEIDGGAKRRRALKLVDRALSKRDYKAALTLVRQLQGKSGGLRAFGAAKQLTKRIWRFDELELNSMELSALLPLMDSVMESIRQCTQVSSDEEVSVEKLERLISENGVAWCCYEQEHLICAKHEAGHFLVGYLLGVLPKEYEVPTIQALKQDKFAQAKVSFLGFEFLQQIDSLKIMSENMKTFHNVDNKGKISSKILNQFSCVTLGGLVAELLMMGYSNGHYEDVFKLVSVLKWVGLPRSDAELHMRWAAMNTAFIMSRHLETISSLAEAMAMGKSVGNCIQTIEGCLMGKDM